MRSVLLFLLALGCASEPKGRKRSRDEPAEETSGLTALQVEGATYWPAFQPDTEAYAVEEAEAASGLSIAPVAADPDASIHLRHETLLGELLDEAEGSIDVVLEHGEQVIIDVDEGGVLYTYRLVVWPDDMPRVTVESFGTPAAGYTFLTDASTALGDPNYLSVLDPNGIPLYYDRDSGSTYDLRVQASGNISWLGYTEGPNPIAVLLDTDWQEIGRVAPVPTADGLVPDTDVHDLIEQPNGNVVVIGTVIAPGDLTALGGDVDTLLMHQVVQELDPERNVVFEWRTDQAFDPAAAPLLVHWPALGAWDYTHVNSVAIDPEDGHLVISARLPNVVLKVARTDTTLFGRDIAAGEVIWKLGGSESDFAFVDDERADGWQGFAGQHHATPLPGGHLLLYDNAMARESTGDLDEIVVELWKTGASRYVEYALDTTGWTATKVAEYELPGSGMTLAGGSAQRLANGNTLVGWGNLFDTTPGAPIASEIDPAGAVVTHLYRDSGWTYRAYRFDDWK